MSLRIQLLGPIHITNDDDVVDLPGNRPLALLAYLLITGRAHSRDHLTDLLFDGPADPRAALRWTLSKLRKAIGSDYVLANRREISFNFESDYWLDVSAFSAGELELFQGDLLEGVYLRDAHRFDDWLFFEREQLRGQYESGLKQRLVENEGRGDYSAVITAAHQLLQLDNLREDYYFALMGAYARLGKREAALSQYHKCRQVLAEELGVEPAPETTALFEQIRDGMLGREAGDYQSTPGSDLDKGSILARPRQNNMPEAATPFVGREEELDALAELIADPQVRLISITGPGGIGKTRLALEAAGRELRQGSRFSDGIFFISLAPLESAEEIVSALVAVLEFHFQGAGDETEQLLNYLRQKQMLLVMDNFEHILDGRVLLAKINQRASEVTLLVTSRERLQMRGEQLFPLGGLETAQAGDSLEESPSAVLFLNIARRTAPDFQLLEEDSDHLLRICRLVEGMPLGLELAASWAGLLPLSEIVAEIEQGLQLLAAEHHDVPRRHQSMEAALDASWRRLTPEQQRAFQELTVFRGGFSRTAALEVAGAALPLLVTLANKSWLTYDRQKDRYQIHELLRQYGAARLSADPAHDQEARERHSAYFCAYLQEREADWFGPRQKEISSEIRNEIDNIQRAWRWAADQGDSALLAQGLDSLCRFYFWEGRLKDGQTACRLAASGLSNAPAKQQTVDAQRLALRSQVLVWESRFVNDVTQKEELLAESQKLLDRAIQGGRDRQAEQAFIFLGKARVATLTDIEEARRFAGLGLKLFRGLGDPIGEAETLALIGHSHLKKGEYDLAGELLRDSLAIRQQLGDAKGISETMDYLGQAARHRGNFEEAERIQRQGLELMRQSQNRHLESRRLLGFTYTQSWAGNFAAARETTDQAIKLSRNLGSYPNPWNLNTLTMITIHLGDYAEAQATAAESLELARQIGVLSEVGWALLFLGKITIVEGDLDQAKDYLQGSAAALEETQHVYRALPQAILSYVFRALGEEETAWHYLGRALHAGAKYRSISPTIYCLPVAALLAADADRRERAVELYGLAQQFGHIRNSRWFEDIACRELDEVRASLPADVAAAAGARGQELDVWETAEALLRELDGSQP